MVESNKLVQKLHILVDFISRYVNYSIFARELISFPCNEKNDCFKLLREFHEDFVANILWDVLW